MGAAGSRFAGSVPATAGSGSASEGAASSIGCMRISAGIPSPAASARIIPRDRGRLRFRISETRERPSMKGSRSRRVNPRLSKWYLMASTGSGVVGGRGVADAPEQRVEAGGVVKGGPGGTCSEPIFPISQTRLLRGD